MPYRRDEVKAAGQWYHAGPARGRGSLKTDTPALREVAALFFRLGVTAFGGPAAHIAMMRDEVVSRRRWITDQEFLDYVGATNLIPGPNSTELAIHLGHLRAGRAGMIVAGLAFILPAVAIVLGLAWAYVTYRTLPEVGWLLYGVKPVVIAIIVQALWTLGRTALKGPATWMIGALALAAYLLGLNEILLLVAGGLGALAVGGLRRPGPGSAPAPSTASSPHRRAPSTRKWLIVAFVSAAVVGALVLVTSVMQTGEYDPSILFLTFVKIGSVLYGSGYVLLAFLRADFVARLGWLTERQLLDAIAVGQVTPGPVFTTATFVGFVIGGWPGALIATAGIFLPAFVFVALSHRIVPQLRASRRAAAFLDGVNVTSLALMGGVLAQLGVSSIVDLPTAGIAVLASLAVLRFRINSTWLILAGAGAGYGLGLFVGPM